LTRRQIRPAVASKLSEPGEWAADDVLGEITVVVGGAPARGATAMDTSEDVAARVAEAERSGLTRKDAMASVTAETGLPNDGVRHGDQGEG
jgi:16S rRNA (cytidine1402-2'-O)-methyltransferase